MFERGQNEPFYVREDHCRMYRQNHTTGKRIVFLDCWSCVSCVRCLTCLSYLTCVRCLSWVQHAWWKQLSLQRQWYNGGIVSNHDKNGILYHWCTHMGMFAKYHCVLLYVQKVHHRCYTQTNIWYNGTLFWFS